MAAPTASFSSFPNLFYLSPEHGSDWMNLELVSGDKHRIRSHQALLGASCKILKKCLLDPKLIPEDQTTIVFPDHSSEEINMFLRIIYGFDDIKQASQSIQELLWTVGFILGPPKPAPSIANIKSELDFDHTADYNQASTYAGHSILDTNTVEDEEDSSNDDDYEYGRAGTEDSNDSDDFLGLVNKPRKRGRKRKGSGNKYWWRLGQIFSRAL